MEKFCHGPDWAQAWQSWLSIRLQTRPGLDLADPDAIFSRSGPCLLCRFVTDHYNNIIIIFEVKLCFCKNKNFIESGNDLYY